MTDVIATIESPELSVSIEDTSELSMQLDSVAIETVPDYDLAMETMTASVSVDSGVGTPSVAVTKTQTEEHLNFDFAFSNLRGNGITNVSLISTVGLTKTYRVTTDSGDFYDMVLNDGNGIASTSFGDGCITFVFTDGTSYTTPSFIPYVVDEIIDDTAESGLDVTWSVSKIRQVIENSGKVLYGTTAEWNAQSSLVGLNQVMYVYTDGLTYDGKAVPRIKIGDGTTYLIDLPFLNEEEIDHINNQQIHVSAADRARWNNKVTTYEPEDELLLITKD